MAAALKCQLITSMQMSSGSTCRRAAGISGTGSAAWAPPLQASTARLQVSTQLLDALGLDNVGALRVPVARKLLLELACRAQAALRRRPALPHSSGCQRARRTCSLPGCAGLSAQGTRSAQRSAGRPR